MKLQPEAADQFLRAERVNRKAQARSSCPTTLLAWKVRAALRADGGKPRWQQVVQAIDAMSPAEQKDAGLGLLEGARPAGAGQGFAGRRGADASSQRAARPASPAQLNFYGQLAAEDLGQPQALPPKPAPLTPAERDAVAAPSRPRRARWR